MPSSHPASWTPPHDASRGLACEPTNPGHAHGRNLALILAGLFAVALSLLLPPSLEGLLRMLPLLPLALSVAAMNAL
jgi:hypothetical protein